MISDEAQHKVLIICPTRHDISELERPNIIGNNILVFHNYVPNTFERILANGTVGSFEQSCPQLIIDQLLDLCQSNVITALFSSDDYPGSIYTSIIAEKLQLPGPKLEPVLRSKHKYYSRCDQKRIIPEATPEFCRIMAKAESVEITNLQFPIFLKPVKSYFSFLAGIVQDAPTLQRYITTHKMPDAYLYQFNWFLQHKGMAPDASDFLVEEVLNGQQVTVEGFIFQGSCHILGITDSIMYPGTMSFARFEYPSCLPESVQKRMEAIAARLMTGIDFDNSLFNIEMMYNPITDQIHIIEVNPRMAAQFADLYEKVDGINSFSVALDIATGGHPTIKNRQGQHAIAASCVMRIFENKRVIKVPTADDIAKVKELFPDSRVFICVEEGQLLSDQLQDGNSYLYCLIHLGARDRQELLEKFECAKKMLPFVFGNK